jgi:anti-sigma-K factor RskA
VLNADNGAPEIGLFRIVIAVTLVVAVLALACSFFVHRFPDEQPEIQAVPAGLPAEAAQ